jgi:predicted RNA binding protein YcfA (HicA-like mRNA interferase family)
MRSVYAALRPGGHFYLSVPQHPWLYSRFDREVGHRRRYTRSEMVDKLRRNGFQVVRVTGSNFFLLPLLFVKRQLDRYLVDPNQKVDIAREMHAGPVSNFLFGTIMQLEMALIRLGVSLPAGGSLVVVARKPD